MTYRDTFDQCPRCQVALVDARAARGCRECGGMWLQEAVLHEMVLEMLPPGLYGKLAIEARPQPIEGVLACPTCQAPMDAVAMHGVAIDRCVKHGLWFDAEELFGVLRRSADPDAFTFVAGTDPPERPMQGRPIVRAPAVATHPAAPPPEPASGPLVILRVTSPDGTVSEHRFERAIIKLGRLPSSHLRFTDEEVARMHALLEVHRDGPVDLIDLGSTTGTLIDGERVAKRSLASGDVFTIAGHQIEVVIPGAVAPGG